MKKLILILILILLFSSGCALRVSITPINDYNGGTTKMVHIDKTGVVLEADRDLIRYIIKETKEGGE